MPECIVKWLSAWRQSALGIPEEEVESWVVRAIGKKLLDARIDQLSRSVTVTRSAHRCFGSEQWQELRAQLSAWAVRLFATHLAARVWLTQ